MTIDDLKKMSLIDLYLHWIKERWNVLQRRRAGKPPPWTEDPLIATLSFTNVRREDDRTTIWVKENIRDPVALSRPAEDVVFAIVAARWFNYIPTMDVLNKNNLFTKWSLDLAENVLYETKKAGKQIFTGAFVIATQSKLPKYQHVCEVYLETAWNTRKEWAQFLGQHPGCTLLNFFTKLSELPGYGGLGFMCQQAICDIKHTWVLADASDWWTWTSQGPGSRRGMNILNGRSPDTPMKNKYFLEEINRLRTLVAKRLPRLPELSASDIQNTLCEYGKYHRAVNGGLIKRKYKPRITS